MNGIGNTEEMQTDLMLVRCFSLLSVAPVVDEVAVNYLEYYIRTLFGLGVSKMALPEG